MDGHSSNGYIRLPQGITRRTCRLVMQARTGTLRTAKMLYRMGKRRTDVCERCGRHPDGVHHSLSGCPAMTGMYTLRHNELGGQGYKTVGKGKLGASVVCQDLGRHNAAETPEEQAEIRTRIGSALKGPRKLTDDERRQFDNYRPDIFIQHDMINFHIVEFKWCRDTDPDQQRENAIEQHQELVAALRNLFGAQPFIVQIHPILIGVTGTIYKDFYDTMDLLGVSKTEAKRSVANLHRIAVSYVDKNNHDNQVAARTASFSGLEWGDPSHSRLHMIACNSGPTVGVWGQASCLTHPPPSLTSSLVVESFFFC